MRSNVTGASYSHMWFPLPGRFFLCLSNGPLSQESLFPGSFSLQLQVGPGLLWAVRACVSLCPCHSVLGGSAEESGSQQTTGLRGWGQGLRRGRGEEAGVGLCPALHVPSAPPTLFLLLRLHVPGRGVSVRPREAPGVEPLSPSPTVR